MRLLQLLPIGDVPNALLQYLEASIPKSLNVSCKVIPDALDPAAAFHAERRQYHSSEIITSMQSLVRPDCWRLLGVADVDLYIPILTFVFGEAQISGSCAVISARRLRQEFYSLRPDQDLLEQRLLKEAVHELGHTCDLTHCDNYLCAMASSHSVEWIDLKQPSFCEQCRRQLARRVQ